MTACPICGSTETALLYEGLRDRVFGLGDWETTLVSCRGCGAAFQDPMPSEEEIPSFYGTYYTHEPPPRSGPPVGRIGTWRRSWRNGFLNATLGYDLEPAWPNRFAAGPLRAYFERGVRTLPKGTRMLDIGSGNGWFLSEAELAGWQAEGIELDEVAAGIAREAGLDAKVETIAALAEREQDAYDAVTMSHVIEHVPDPVGFLRDVRTVMRDTGTLWIATPNLASTGHREFRDAWIGLDPPRHLVLFDAHSLAQALFRAGFDHVRVQPVYQAAYHTYRVSAAARAGEVPAYHTENEDPAVRRRAALDTVRWWHDRLLADELVVTATPA